MKNKMKIIDGIYPVHNAVAAHLPAVYIMARLIRLCSALIVGGCRRKPDEKGEITMALLEIKDVSYDYELRSGKVHALKNVTAEFDAGKMYAVTGRSGSGKTTLLSLIAAFDVPLSGEILYNGVSISSEKPSVYRRKNIGMIFQSYNLIQHLTALENVMLSLEITHSDPKNRKNTAREILRRVGIKDELFGKRPLTLSGGEQQRVAIARAIAADSQIILADEPTGNLDNENSENIIGLLKSLAHERDKCVIVVTHSEDIAAEADLGYHMSNGMIA